HWYRPSVYLHIHDQLISFPPEWYIHRARVGSIYGASTLWRIATNQSDALRLCIYFIFEIIEERLPKQGMRRQILLYGNREVSPFDLSNLKVSEHNPCILRATISSPH